MNDRLDQLGLRRAFVVGAILATGGLLWFVPCRRVEIRACPISGSSLETTWWFGLPWKKKQTTTRLERWLKIHEPGFEPRWNFVGERSDFATGATIRSCGKDPVAHMLAGRVDDFVDAGDEAKIAGLVLVIRGGTSTEQRDAIDRLWAPPIEEP